MISIDFKVGDHVTFLVEDADTVRTLQKGHGGWAEDMFVALAHHVGRLVKVYPDNDVRVHVLGKEWTLNPACLKKAPPGVHHQDRTPPEKPKGSNIKRDDESFLRSCNNGDLQTIRLLLDKSLCTLVSKTIRSGLHEASLNGHLSLVKELTDRFPDEIVHPVDGKNVLQVSCHRGNLDIVKYLLSAKERQRVLLNKTDHEGDSALHYAAYGKKTAIVQYLLHMGANVNAINEKKCSVLHVSVLVSDVDTVRLLLGQQDINVNIQDAFEDTPLHEAIVKNCAPIVDLLCHHPTINFTISNKRGFNTIQYAALKGSDVAMKKVLEVTERPTLHYLINLQKDDGFTPLHLSTLNGHAKVSACLLSIPEVNMMAEDVRGRNCLHCAIHQGHARITELLIDEADQRCSNNKADNLANPHLKKDLIDGKDVNGDTCLHVALRREGEPPQSGEDAPSPNFQLILSKVASSGLIPKLYAHTVAIAALLISHGANLSIRNNNGCTPKDFVQDSNIRLFLNQCEAEQEKASSMAASAAAAALTENITTPEKAAATCQICCETLNHNLRPVQFEPCGHVIVCTECSPRMKRCIECKEKIEKKRPLRPESNSAPLTSDIDAHHHRKSDGTPDDEVVSLRTLKLHDLEAKVQDFELAYLCSICMEKRKNVAFLCGHGACTSCVETLKSCHMCRGPISHKINLY